MDNLLAKDENFIVSIVKDEEMHEDIIDYTASAVTKGVGGDESEYGRPRSIDD